MFLSGASFIAITILDRVADFDMEKKFGENWKVLDDRLDMTLRMIIKALGILVGFSWEQCFDEAVASIASRTESPHAVKAFLALSCALVIVPAYKMYTLPMAVLDGWKHGFVIKQMGEFGDMHEAAHEVMTHLQKKFKHAAKSEEQGEEDERTKKMREKINKTANKMQQVLLSMGNSPGTKGYSNLPGSPEEEMLRLRKENVSYKTALREGVQALRWMQQAEQERAEELRTQNSQMDQLLERVRELEARFSRPAIRQRPSDF
jgi:hypothetical protein